MKNLIFFFSLILVIGCFSSCKKDNDLQDMVEKTTDTKKGNADSQNNDADLRSGCEPATNISTEVDGNSVIIRFDANSAGTSHIIDFKKVGEESGQSFTTLVNAASIAELDKNTEYEVTVRTLCGSIGSPTSGSVKFTTGDTNANCAQVAAVKITEVTTTSVQISFAAVHGKSQYTFLHRKKGEQQFTSQNTSIEAASLHDLEPGTEYEVMVKALCGEIGAENSEVISFTTEGNAPSDCAKAQNIQIDIDGTVAKVHWEGAENGTQHFVQFRKVGDTEFKHFITYTNSASISILEANTDYEIKVRTLCGEIGSDWTTIQTFQTGAGSYTCAPITSLTVRVEENTTIVEWGAVYGKSQYSVLYRKVGEALFSSKLSSFESFYFVDLAPNTEYEVMVQTLCGGAGSDDSEIIKFTTTDSSCEGAAVNLRLTLDNYASETTFKLENNVGDILFSNDAMSNGTAGTVIGKDTVLPDGNYTFTLNDSYGDGICCDYGEGSIKFVNDDGTELKVIDGAFGLLTTVTFSVENCQVNDDWNVSQDARLRSAGSKN